MSIPDANIDLCGIVNLLMALKKHGYSDRELRKIIARIAVKTGADIIIPTAIVSSAGAA